MYIAHIFKRSILNPPSNSSQFNRQVYHDQTTNPTIQVPSDHPSPHQNSLVKLRFNGLPHHPRIFTTCSSSMWLGNSWGLQIPPHVIGNMNIVNTHSYKSLPPFTTDFFGGLGLDAAWHVWHASLRLALPGKPLPWDGWSCKVTNPGWWYTNPSEKCESRLG